MRNCPFTTSQGSWDSPNWKARCITSAEEGILSSSTSPEEVVDEAFRMVESAGNAGAASVGKQFSFFAQRLIPAEPRPYWMLSYQRRNAGHAHEPAMSGCRIFIG